TTPDHLADLTSCPTTPCHERCVPARIVDDLGLSGLAAQVDPWGNLLARLRRGDSRRPVALVAHMDHPGLELIDPDEAGRPRARVLGGLAPELFADRPALRLYPQGSREFVPARALGCLDGRTGNRALTLDSGACDGMLRTGDLGW